MLEVVRVYRRSIRSHGERLQIVSGVKYIEYVPLLCSSPDTKAFRSRLANDRCSRNTSASSRRTTGIVSDHGPIRERVDSLRCEHTTVPTSA